jgi:hypothetical protein
VKERPIIMPAELPQNRAERLQRVAAFLARLPADKPWELVVRPWKKPRTGRQNNATWGVAYGVLSDFTGHTEVELHDIMCRLFFGEVSYECMGKRMTKPRRTTTTNERGERDVISREDMARFYDLIVRTAAEQGCYIPDPDPLLRVRAA